MSDNPAETSASPPLKIALVILHADPARGGAERYTVDLAAALARRGQRVALVASGFASPIEAVEQVRLDAGGATRTGGYHRFLEALETHLTQQNYDIVHAMLPVRQCDLYHPHAGIAIESLQRTGWRLPFNWRRKAFADVEREMLAHPDAPLVLCLSEYVKRNVLKHYPGLAAEHLATLFNATDLNRFAIADRSFGESVRALMIANDFDRKGLPQTIRALAKVREPRLALDVIGKEDTRSHANLARELGVAESVIFKGQTTDPRAQYAAADFFVLPTRHDPCSLVVLEALAMGLPVISTRFNGACEIMTDGVHGYVLDDPDDIDALADAMRKMLDPERRRAMSNACLELRQKLSYEHHLDELIRIYRGVQLKSGRNV